MKTLTASISLIALAATSFAAPAFAQAEAASTTQPAAQADTRSREVKTTARDYWGDWGIDLSEMDKTVDPGNDFYEYVNGKWLQNFQIPADRARYGSFSLLAEKSEQRVRNIIDDLAAEKPDVATLNGKIAAYYNTYMDVDAINAAGLAPVQPQLAVIKNISSRDDLAKVFASTGFSSPFGGYVDIDSKEPDKYTFYMSQSGLGLPDRDYYLVDSEKNLEIRAAYKKYLAFLLGKAGYSDADTAADSVYALEESIARQHWDRAAGRNRDLTYNKVDKAGLEKLAGDFPVDDMLSTLGIPGQNEFVIRQITPTAEEVETLGLTDDQLAKLGGGIPGLFKIAEDAPIPVWQAYLSAHLLSDFASVLPSDIDQASFDFYGKTLSGQEVQRDRWKRAVASVEGAMGEGVGKIYAAKYFPPENKAAMDDLVANLRKAMAANLSELSWMGDATKVEAEQKLDKFTPKIGYTQKFETYDNLNVEPGNAFANSLAAQKWALADNLSHLGQPIDETEWGMLPETVNAYYSPNRNEIVFPAAILQPPFFNITADDAVNYGAVGGVIGHEMGHGFDDQGAKSDGDGRLRNWWTDADKANFDKLTNALVAQYNGFCPLDDGKTCVNGSLTLGENIGDLGGLSMAYRAYKMSLNGKEAPVIDGLTGDQRFFMAWAQVWRNKSREEYLRQQLTTDPHSPADYRVNGVVRNFDEWYKAFDVKPGDKLYLAPDKRIRIW